MSEVNLFNSRIAGLSGDRVETRGRELDFINLAQTGKNPLLAQGGLKRKYNRIAFATSRVVKGTCDLAAKIPGEALKSFEAIAMNDYHKSVVAQFFKPLPKLSQLSCHRFVFDHVAPVLLPHSTDKVDVQPSPFQGSMSYTTILSSAHDGRRTVVQFRDEKQDLSGVTEANRIHGTLVPLVTYRGTYEGLFVYTSPLAAGTPYVHILMSSPDIGMPLHQQMATAIYLADITTREVRANTTACNLSSALDGIQSTVNSYAFRNTGLRSSISTCISKLLPQLPDLATLPIALTHQDLTPFNYLVDDSSGRIEAILDWDGALYLPVGSNFHFVENLFGFMTLNGWEDTEDRSELEAAFYARALASLAAQGFGGVTKGQLESQKAIGMLQYYVARLLRFQNERMEQYLDVYLRRLTFMHGSMSPC